MDWGAMMSTLSQLDPRMTTIVHGDEILPFDDILNQEAQRLGMCVKIYPVEWHKYQRSAPEKRNRMVLVTEHPDLVLLFTDGLLLAENIAGSDIITMATGMGVPVMRVYHHSDTGKVVSEWILPHDSHPHL